ncbi:MAG: tetratricopeptide repeat protein [Eubacteriales bacterium]|nr:tetratricopeptide repeat protein [Eubacteriales bacterium]
MKKNIRILAPAFGIAMLTALCFSGCGNKYKEIYEQAEKDLDQGMYDFALDEFRQTIEGNYNVPQSYRGAGVASMKRGEYETAIEYFDYALGYEKLGTSLEKDLLDYRATANLKLGNASEAMSDCQKLLSLGSLNQDEYFLLGKVALELDSYDEAADYFQKSFAENTDHDTAIEIYQAYVEKGMEADGTAYLEASLNTSPKTAEDYYDRGRVYYYMDDYNQAQQELITAVNQGSTEAMLLLGSVYLARNDTSNARAMYLQYVSEEGNAAKGYNGLAMCDIEDGNYSSALQNIQMGLENASTSEMQDLMFNEIVVYEKQLDFTTALQKTESYLNLFPADEAAKKELTFLQSRTGIIQ